MITCVDISIKGVCLWKDCRNPLPRRKRKYCSRRCANFFFMNHFWSSAARWAIKFADWTCELCHSVDADNASFYVRDELVCSGLALEVNHIKPLNGSERNTTCANHQLNLQVLCHKCHVEVTNQQNRERKNRVDIA